MKNHIQESKIDELNSWLWKNRYNDNIADKNGASNVLAKSEKAKYLKGIAYARLNIAVSCFLHSKNESALENISEALLWFVNNPAEWGYPCALNLKGSLHESFADYEKALQYCLNAYKIATKINDKDTEAETCSQLGLIYTRLTNFPKALEFYNKGLAIREEKNDENAMASSLNRIGMIMRMTKKYEQSLMYYNKSLEIRTRNKQVASVPWTMLGIASTYEEMQKTSDALEYYEQGMKGGDIRCTLQCRLGSGRIYSNAGNHEKAEKRLIESLRIAQDLKALSLVAESYSALANHYELTGQVENALRYFKLFQKAKESINNEDAQNRLRNVEISYAIEKSENEKEIYRLRHVELKQAYDTIEENNKYITASINYASRIQHSMLPDINEIEDLNRNCFVLYLPKEIVSGDFYWFSQSGEKLFAVAGDCTGHGVPGALMSMLGISFLEEIINYRKITDSGLILDELRNEVQHALHQKGFMDETKDGMDISLCVIDKQKNTIQYSGAYNNMYLIRNGQITEYLADKMPIGIFELSETNFTSQCIHYLPGDLIYMFSDGYADQFGGPNRKKFRYPALKTLLLGVHKLPINRQKQNLDKAFHDWKRTNDQVDDVLILGLKL